MAFVPWSVFSVAAIAARARGQHNSDTEVYVVCFVQACDLSAMSGSQKRGADDRLVIVRAPVDTVGGEEFGKLAGEPLHRPRRQSP